MHEARGRGIVSLTFIVMIAIQVPLLSSVSMKLYSAAGVGMYIRDILGRAVGKVGCCCSAQKSLHQIWRNCSPACSPGQPVLPANLLSRSE
ncbi:hypothetical protein BQ8482_60205 [Mesorhizobium delmotii]|uniref:Uncharacterized protein n=1 Tax=Mesorhizobium delmotii TaxID=1631247 RepID=A0A2P9AVR5_9HYPH|nr:hypothetical protein BQ8482_60205 [Mesorhizobium delmotii]